MRLNDLGDHHYRRGDLANALRYYRRTNDYCTTSKNIAQMCVSVIKVSIELGQFETVAEYIAKAESTPDIARDVRHGPPT